MSECDRKEECEGFLLTPNSPNYFLLARRNNNSSPQTKTFNNSGTNHSINDAPAATPSISGKSVNAILTTAFQENGFKTLQSFQSGVTAAGGGGDGPEFVATFDAIKDQNVDIASACSKSTREYQIISTLFLTLLSELPENSNAFKAAVETFEAIGLALVITKPT